MFQHNDMITTINEFRKVLEIKNVIDINNINITYLSGNGESYIRNLYTLDDKLIDKNTPEYYDIVNMLERRYSYVIFAHDHDEVTKYGSITIKDGEIVSNTINENIYNNITKIGKINKEIEIEIDLEHTAHSMERQGRSNTYIKNSDIKETVDMATEEIFDALVTDKLNVGDRMCIKNADTDLNVVGSIISNKKNDGVIFKVITVMIHKEFRNVAGTYEIYVSKNK